MNLSSAAEGKAGSSFPVAVLMRASFIIALKGFCDCTWRNFQRSWNVSCHNMDVVFYQIGLSSVYHPYLVTTQLIGSNALIREAIPPMNF
jgi:hypothetical protein